MFLFSHYEVDDMKGLTHPAKRIGWFGVLAVIALTVVLGRGAGAALAQGPTHDRVAVDVLRFLGPANAAVVVWIAIA